MVDTKHSSPPDPLPLRRRSPIPRAQIDAGSSAVCLNAWRRVLIVDDCRFIAERMARVLEARSFHCTIVADGYQGMQLLSEEDFDMVVLEVNTPVVDGFTLLRHIRDQGSTHAKVPVLMLSGEQSIADYDRAVELGADGYLAKPLQRRPLDAMLDSML